jgi:hypothetical protein
MAASKSYFTREEMARRERAISRVLVDRWTLRAAAAEAGCADVTVRKWVRRRDPTYNGRHSARERTLPLCPICSIVLGRDSSEDPYGNILHPPSPTDAERCWRCQRDYGDTPLEELPTEEEDPELMQALQSSAL